MSTDSDHKPESSEPRLAQSGVAVAESAGAERSTRPEFALRSRGSIDANAPAPTDSGAPSLPARSEALNTVRQAMPAPAFTVEAADAYADSIRPAWEEPSFRTLRPPAARESHEPSAAAAGAASEPPLPLSADEADAYAARIQPSWAPPPAWSAPFLADEPLDEPDRDWVSSDRRRMLRGALIASAFALLGAALGALLALAPQLGGGPHPAGEKTKLSALTAAAIPAADPPSAQPLPPIAADKPSDVSAVSGTIRVRIAAEPPRAQISLDGVEVQNPFDARRPKGGRHRVLIRAKGRATRDLTLTFERDEHVRVALDPLP